MVNTRFWFGIAAVVCSAHTTTFGLFIQKLAHTRNTRADSIPEDKRRSYDLVSAAIWSLGLCMTTFISFILDAYSFATLAQSMVVPMLASLTIVSNQLFAPIVLGEVFERKDMFSTVAIIAAVLVVAVFGPGAGNVAPEFGDYASAKRYFSERFSDPLFFTFEVIAFPVFLMCLGVYRWPQKFQRWQFAAVGFLAAYLTGHQNLMLKGASTLVGMALKGHSGIFTNWVIYAFIGAVNVIGMLAIFFVNVGLARFQALIFIPSFNGLYISLGTLLGLLFYAEWVRMTPLGWAMFAGGLGLIGSALGALSQKAPADTATDMAELTPKAASEGSAV